MAKKKIYAVRKGHKTGLFETWAECQKATSGYSGAEFRGFTDREEAMAFLQISTTANVSKDEEKEAAGIVEVPENMVIAYVDGSFEKSIGRYAFGCVILTPAGEEFRKSGSGCDPEGVKIRNVAGEMLGAMNAVQWAKEQIKISFCKVAAHTGNHYNEEADQLAKSALLRTDENVSI